MLLNTRLRDLLNTLSGITEDLLWKNAGKSKEIQEVIKEIQKEQLSQGERPDGSNFPNYGYISQLVYGKPDSPITWYDDGEMYSRITPQFTPNEIDMGQALTTGDDNEELDLEIEYNEDILGIQERNLAAIKSQIKAEYIMQLRWFLDEY